MTTREKLDPSALTSIYEIENAIKEHEHKLFQKINLKGQITSSKKEAAAAFREQLEEINEEIDFEVEVIKSVFDRKKVLGFNE